MHEGETVISIAQARALVAAQLPQWAGLALRPLGVAGSDNVMLRLGDGLVLRFPRHVGAVAGLEVEARWPALLCGVGPLAVPEVLHTGAPGEGYPFPWLVLRWIKGRDALAEPVADLELAGALAGFVSRLRDCAVPEGVPPRPGRLQDRDGFLRQMIGQMVDEADPGQVTRAWEAALDLPDWEGAPVLVHADLHPLNLIVRDGAVAAVIDWGGMGAGDPALDLICGWTALEAEGRAVFRQRLAVDDATWARGWAHAFSKAVMAAPYYRETNPALRAVMLRTLRRCLSDLPW